MAQPEGCVALVRGGALGDFVLTLPAAAALRQACPGAKLLVVGNPARAALAAPADAIDADGARWARLFAPGGAPDRTLRERFAGCRLVLAFTPAGPGAVRLGEALRDLAGQVILADPRPPAGTQRHAVEHLLDPLRCRGLADGDAFRSPRIDLAAAGGDPQRRPPGRGDRGTLVVHPGSGSPEKCWPADRFAALVRRLSDRNLPVALLWGPAEAEREAQLASHFPPGVPRLRPASPIELARRLAAARLYIGNDSGPGHVAAAVGTPTVSLFGPTDPAVWRPLGPRARVVRSASGDLSEVTVDDVLGEVLAALAEEEG